MTAPTESEVSADGVAIHYRTEGDGPPVILLHGFTGSVDSMSGFAAELSASHRVISIDLIGHGSSDSPAQANHYRMSAAVRHVLTVIDHLGLERIHLCGYSMGARTALAVACARPDWVLSLSLIGVHPGLEDRTAARARRDADDQLAQSILDQPLSLFVDRWMANPLFATQARLGANHLEASRGSRLRNNPVGLAASLRGMGTGSMPALVGAVGVVAGPTELIVGEEDEKFRGIADELAPLFASATVHVVPGVGHATHLEAPEATAEIVRASIARVEQDRRPAD